MKMKDLAGHHALYFEYLMDLVGGERMWNGFDENFVRLFYRRYYWKHPIDRALESHVGLLRKKAYEVGHVPIEAVLVGEPSVLEVLVHLAIEVEMKIMYEAGDDVPLRISGFFSDLITALGFDCDLSELDKRLDGFLDGTNRICNDPDAKGLPLWTQCNWLFMDQFRIEADNIV